MTFDAGSGVDGPSVGGPSTGGPSAGGNPFLPPESERSDVRRFRARLTAPVVLWTAVDGRRRGGLPVSSTLVAEGEPAHVLGLIDEESALWDALSASGKFAIAVLRWPHRGLADAFAGTAPAPGGPFRLTQWQETSWGLVPESVTTWAGCRVEEIRQVGWSRLVDGVIEQVAVGNDEDPLIHRRGRYGTSPE